MTSQPRVFQNGFVANRIAREEQARLPRSIVVSVRSFRQNKGVLHVIEKDDNGVKTYWVNEQVGFAPWEAEHG